MDETSAIDCCEMMRAAQTEGTDNEGYESLIHYHGDAEYRSRLRPQGYALGWYMGDMDDLDPIKFCPWCGRRITQADKEATA